jgi:hypothetical protein
MTTKILATLASLCALAANAAAHDLISNGSFESGTNGWMLSGGAGRYQLVNTAHAGASALRVFNRFSFTNAPQQDVTAALLTATNGGVWTTRLAVQVAFPTTVRAWLRVVADNGGLLVTNRQLLAERVLRTTNSWMLLTGTKAVAWTGNLTEALFYTESGMKQELNGTQFPATIFDSIAVRPDADGDGLWDDEEVAMEQGGTGTDPSLHDTDGDGLPDGWEVAHGTDAFTPDATSDPDHDTFTNWQEFHAATQPTNALSFPGRPRVGGLSESTRAVQTMLALAPSGPTNRCFVGQHLTEIEREWTNHVINLQALSGRWPAVISFAAESGPGPLQMNVVVPRALEAWTNGSLVLIKWSMQNPWNNLMSSATNPVGVNIPELLNPATPLATNQVARSNYLAWRTAMGDSLATLRDAGAVVLFRPFSEVNGVWFWWGNKPRDQYLALWRDLHDHFTFARGLTNLLWVYEPDQTVHLVSNSASSGTPIDYYYPGDDVTDVVGHNFYDDDWKLPYDSDAVWRNYEKPFAVPQAGPGPTRDGSFDNLTYLHGVTNTIPRLSFFCVWNSFPIGGGGTNFIAISDNLNASNLLAHPLLATREEVDWAYHLPMGLSVGRVAGGVEVRWQGGILQHSTNLVDWHDLPGASRPWRPDIADVWHQFWRVRK